MTRGIGAIFRMVIRVRASIGSAVFIQEPRSGGFLLRSVAYNSQVTDYDLFGGGLFGARKLTTVEVRFQCQNPSLILKKTPHENTALHIAVTSEHMNVVAEIFSRRPSLLTQPNLDGDTPLHVAARKGQFPMVNFLVAKILSSSKRDIDDIRNGGIVLLRRGNSGNNTILHEAVWNHQLKVVDLLLNVDPGLACFVNNAGESPLYLAARDGMLKVVNRILVLARYAHGGSDGQNALHAAIAEGHFDIIEALLRAELQLIQETDHQGRTSHHYAVHLGDNRMAQRLLELDTCTAYALDKDGQSSLHFAASKGHTKLVKEIIRHSPDSGELVDLIGRNALHVAIPEGKVNVIRFVLETKELEGLINQADYDGNTPLQTATMGRKSWILRLLIWDGRADRRAKNKSGKTAIDESIGEQFAGVSRAPVSGISRHLCFPQVTGEKLSPNEDQDPAAATLQTYKKMSHTVLMVATLTATVTYAAAFTMPGGYKNDVGPEQGWPFSEQANVLSGSSSPTALP
ncbi:hypothetical protein RJ639_022254 [Escallonia herrerae]|uniref:PGG domain-containing protein n=1 Tax=Escallonia herrerae TaxID=1293975 RepID=A0AA88V6M0_9ASTE|nr:hypothetical protein RJ639_022254 [Escallonia herrerae]